MGTRWSMMVYGGMIISYRRFPFFHLLLRWRASGAAIWGCAWRLTCEFQCRVLLMSHNSVSTRTSDLICARTCDQPRVYHVLL
jgi:hypothetical protein